MNSIPSNLVKISFGMWYQNSLGCLRKCLTFCNRWCLPDEQIGRKKSIELVIKKKKPYSLGVWGLWVVYLLLWAICVIIFHKSMSMFCVFISSVLKAFLHNFLSLFNLYQIKFQFKPRMIWFLTDLKGIIIIIMFVVVVVFVKNYINSNNLHIEKFASH